MMARDAVPRQPDVAISLPSHFCELFQQWDAIWQFFVDALYTAEVSHADGFAAAFEKLVSWPFGGV